MRFKNKLLSVLSIMVLFVASSFILESNAYADSSIIPTNEIENHDFEAGNLTGWTVVSGNAFTNTNVCSDGTFNRNGLNHLLGYRGCGDDPKGVLKSSNFIVGGNGIIDFLMAGGSDIDNLYVALVRTTDGTELFKATGYESEEYQRVCWNAKN